ncbi:MAG: cell division protein FtsQ [Thiomicrorhabdus sp.]|nr:MAG: cell division protein FtsQ [Thiomicrorhabdus sp.]
MKRNILGGVLLMTLLGLIVSVWFLFQKGSILFRPIQSYVMLTDIEYVKATEIDAVMDSYLGLSFWDVDLEKIQSILTRLDWVSSALVKRSWPDKLYVSLYEQKPVARWGESGLVNHEGAVFYPKNLTGFSNLVTLNGQLSESSSLLLALSAFQKELNKIQFTVSFLTRQLDGVWRISLHNGSQIIVESQGSEDKLGVFVKAYPKLSKALRKSPQIYDLRYSNGFIVGKSVSQNSPE